jgi:Domain of unknown function (DUF4349)
METSIGYLRTVHGDLLAAARSEARGASSTTAASGGPRPRNRLPMGFVAAAVTIVVLAGLIGAVIRSGGVTEHAATGGADDGATAATGLPEGATIRGPQPGAGDQGMAATPPHPGDLSPPEGGEPPLGPPTISRIIRIGDISVIIPRDSFDDRFAAVVDAAEDNRGFVAESRSRERAGMLTLRVPSARFDETLDAIRDLGTVAVESLRGRDVTAEYVDLRARLRIAKSRRDVLLRLMDRATSIEQTIRVQNALDETQLRIEQIQGQLRLLNDQTSFATITVDLREEGVAADVEAASIPNAFERAGAGFIGVIAAIIIGLGYLIPIALLAVIAWFVWTRVQRRGAVT